MIKVHDILVKDPRKVRHAMWIEDYESFPNFACDSIKQCLKQSVWSAGKDIRFRRAMFRHGLGLYFIIVCCAKQWLCDNVLEGKP